jgi:protease I
MPSLKGKKIAILATDGFEQSELLEPQRRLQEAEAEVDVVSPKSGEIRGWNHTDWGRTVTVNKTLTDVSPDEYDGLVLPGGQINPDLLRVNPDALSFVKSFFEARKPVAAICHAPWLLIEAGVIRGRKATSYHSIKTDMKNAGADWVDQEVVMDDGLITSRNPDDLPVFCDKAIEAFAEGGHAGRRVA